VLLQPLPYAKPEELVFLYDSTPGFGIPKFGLIEAEFLRVREQEKSFEKVALYTSTTLTMTGAGEPERVAAGTASGDFFATLGVPLALGRTFNREEEPQGANNAVILSHDFWQRKFAGNPAVVGQALTLNGRSHTIIGVLPQRFKAPQELQTGRVGRVWVPARFSPGNLWCSHELQGNGPLRSGPSVGRAQAEISTIISGVIKEYAEMFPKDGSAKTFPPPFQQEVVGDVGRT